MASLSFSGGGRRRWGSSAAGPPLPASRIPCLHAEAAGLPPAGPTPRGVPAAAGEGRDAWPGVACNYRSDAPARGSRRRTCTRHPACAAPRRERSDGAGGGPRRQDADAGPGWGSNSGCTRCAASIIEAAGSNPTSITDERAGALRVHFPGAYIIALMCAPGESQQNEWANPRESLRARRPHSGRRSRRRTGAAFSNRGIFSALSHFRWMKQRMHALQRDCSDVRINGRGFQTRMPQHFLNKAHVTPGFQQMRGKGMAE